MTLVILFFPEPLQRKLCDFIHFSHFRVAEAMPLKARTPNYYTVRPAKRCCARYTAQHRASSSTANRLQGLNGFMGNPAKRQVSFHCAWLDYTSHALWFLQTEGKTSTTKKTICFTAALALLWWSGTEPTASPRHGCSQVESAAL